MRYCWTYERHQITYSERITHAKKMVDSCSRENVKEFSALKHDHGYCYFVIRVSGKILNQIFLEVLMNCTKHFDLSTSLMASCVARFIIC